MKVTFLDTVAFNHSILIDDFLLLDCGEGTAQKLFQINGINSIKSICFSHLHVDHLMGIFSLLTFYAIRGRKEDLTIYGPSGTKETIEQILVLLYKSVNPNFQGTLNSFPFKIHFPVLIRSSEIQEIQDNYKIKYIQMEHRKVPAFAYRMERDGKSICYSGDTRPNPRLIKLARKCNIFICESTFPDRHTKRAEETGHCTTSDTAKMARDADCEKLVVVHIDPRYKEEINIFEMQKIFNKEILIAQKFMTLEILP
jgi:ribonuclease Z